MAEELSIQSSVSEHSPQCPLTILLCSSKQVGSAMTMPPPTLLLDCTDLRRAHGQGSQATRQSDTPRNMEPHLPSPWAAQAAGSRREGQAGGELGVQRAHESDPLPQTRWEAAGDWHTALNNTQPGRKERGGGWGQRKPYAQNYLHFITSIRILFFPPFPTKCHITELSHLWCKWKLKWVTKQLMCANWVR